MKNRYECSDIYLVEFKAGYSLSPVIDFGQHYNQFLIWCENCAGIRVNTKLGFLVACSDATCLCSMYHTDDLGTLFETKVPTVGTFAFLMTQIKCVSGIQLKLSQSVTQNVVMQIRGIEPAEPYA